MQFNWVSLFLRKYQKVLQVFQQIPNQTQEQTCLSLDFERKLWCQKQSTEAQGENTERLSIDSKAGSSLKTP